MATIKKRRKATTKRKTNKSASPVRRKKAVKTKKAIGHHQKAHAIVRKIEALEAKRSTLTHKELKDIYALMINKEHDKLDKLKKQLK